MNFILGLYKHKRVATTHIFVVLISTEQRSKNPYALLVQHEVDKLRAVLNRIVSAMVDRSMDVSGK